MIPLQTKHRSQGHLEFSEPEALPDNDPDCYLCPGNQRLEGDTNPDYAGPGVLDNDFSALSNAGPYFHGDNPLRCDNRVAW